MMETSRVKKRAWNLANPEKVRAHKKAYYERHKDRLRAQSKQRYPEQAASKRARAMAYYAANKERVLARQKQSYADNPVHFREASRAYRASRIDVYRERDKLYSKAYRLRDPEREKGIRFRGNHKRRAHAVAAFVETIDRLAVFNRDKGVCGICGGSVVLKSRWHVDHVIPLSRGGVHSYDNVQLAHATCNLSKQDKVPVGQLGLFQVGGRP